MSTLLGIRKKHKAISVIADQVSPSDTDIINPNSRHNAQQKRKLFYIINLLLFAIVSIGMAINPQPRIGDGVFVILLTIICTSPILFVSSYRGKQSLLLVFLAFYFGAFGLKDISNLLSGQASASLEPSSLLSGGEIVILIGAIFFIIGYVSVTRLTPEHSSGILTREWSPKSMLILGILFWVIGFAITTYWQFGMGDRFSGFRLPPSIGGFVGLMRILQPLGTLVLIYLFLTTQNRLTLSLLIFTMVADFGLGFLGDSKELAVRGPLLYLFSYILLRERLPLIQVVAFILAAGLAFNIFASYRISVHSQNESRSEAFQNIGSKLQDIASQDKTTGERLADGLGYFASRITLKHSVELIVARTGKDIAYQNGHTIKPILYAFIPRFITPNKEDSSMAGRLFNLEFKISASPHTKIATSQIGELYWNFGWPGVLIGMVIIGSIMATIAAAVRLDTRQTLPRFLLLLMTVYILTLRFETAIAQNYTVWARAAILLLLLNAFAPKARKPAHDTRKPSPFVGTSGRHLRP